MKTLIHIFKQIGLTDKEAKVYLGCIEKGSSPVSHIAESAGINRVTTYSILEKLIQKGLVSFYSKKKLKFFTAADPEIVVEEFEKRAKQLKSVLPDLKRLTGQTQHPQVRFFEGIEGIKTIYADTLTSQTEILNYSNSDEIRQHWPSYDQDYVKKRAKKGIFLRGLCPKDIAGEKVHKEDKKYNRDMQLLPEDQFDFSNEINIYDNKVAIISYKNELIGMIIESKAIADSQRAIFNICWQFSEILGSKEKMLNPISEKELTKLSDLKKLTEAKTLKEDNLSLF